MRNALDDLTRPRPAGLTGTLVAGRLHIEVAGTEDPNVDHFSAFIRSRGRWVRVCSGTHDVV